MIMCEAFEPIKITSIMVVCRNTDCNYEIGLDFYQKLGLMECPKCGTSLGRPEDE